MRVEVFHSLLDIICTELTEEAQDTGFKKALDFEKRVREITQRAINRVDNGELQLNCDMI